MLPRALWMFDYLYSPSTLHLVHSLLDLGNHQLRDREAPHSVTMVARSERNVCCGEPGVIENLIASDSGAVRS